MIEVSNLVKKYGDHTAVDHLSFQIEKGKIYGFLGPNGMTQREGFTTPESNEALVKRTAMEQCLEKYVVSDSSKFGQISAVTFFSFDGAVILTESCSKEYKDCRNIQIVS